MLNFSSSVAGMTVVMWSITPTAAATAGAGADSSWTRMAEDEVKYWYSCGGECADCSS